jgi:hypothetical protein
MARLPRKRATPTPRPHRGGDGLWRDVRDWLATARSAWTAYLQSLLVTFAVLLQCGSHQWFFTDEWGYITRNLPGMGRLGLFVPHSEYWSTIPILVYRGLFAAFGLHSHLPVTAVLMSATNGSAAAPRIMCQTRGGNADVDQRLGARYGADHRHAGAHTLRGHGELLRPSARRGPA